MKSNLSTTLRALSLGLLLLLCGSLPLRAEQFGLFTYELVNGATATITYYPDNATGPVEIPAEIDGKPVTSIGSYAFSGCTGLTSVTIPSSVTSIGYSAFSNCTSLTNIEVMSGGPVVDGNTLSIRFLADTDGLVCYAETSTDLIHWTTTGVTTSYPDGLRTASVPINGPQCFMRVVVIPIDEPFGGF